MHNEVKALSEWSKVLQFRKLKESGVKKSAYQILAPSSYGIEFDDIAKVFDNADIKQAAEMAWMSERIKTEALYARYVEEQRSEIERYAEMKS